MITQLSQFFNQHIAPHAEMPPITGQGDCPSTTVQCDRCSKRKDKVLMQETRAVMTKYGIKYLCNKHSI